MKGKVYQFSFGDGYAGSAKMAILSSELLMKKGYDVKLFVSKNSLTERRGIEKSINVVPFNTNKRYKELIDEIIPEVEKNIPDWVIAYHSLDRKVGISLKKKFGKKIKNIAYRQNESLSAPVIGSLIYNFYYDYQIACSEGVAKSLVKSGILKRKVKVIHNCVEVPSNINSFSGEEVKKKFSLQNKFVLGLSTWFHKERKGFDILFNAFQKLDEKFVMLIMGIPKEMQNEVYDFAKTFNIDNSKIIMPGYVDDIWNYYKAMDIFLLPSRSEGFSLALMEAAAAKLPIIASNISGNNEFIIDGENGFLFDVNDHQELKNKIVELSVSQNLMNSFAEKANQKVMENFLTKHLAIRLDDFLQSIKIN